VRFDENGWALDAVRPLPLERSYSIFAKEATSRIDQGRWVAQAQRFFSCELRVLTPKRYPGGAEPRADVAEIEIVGCATVRVLTVSSDAAPDLRTAALAVASGGLELLVAKSRRLWQIELPLIAGDHRGALLAAALVASLVLGPILPPTADALYGVKGARERLGI
jgi:hypothetical protein